MKKKSEQKQSSDEVILLGTTTLRFMLDSVYDERSALKNRNDFSECGGAYMRFKDDPSIGDRTAYVYYHPKKDKTIMTTIEGDIFGLEGSSAGFSGKVDIS